MEIGKSWIRAGLGMAGLACAGQAAAQEAPTTPGPVAGDPNLIVPHNWQVWHPEPVTPIAEQLFDFHAMLFWIMFAICALVLGLLAYVIVKFNSKKNPEPSRTTHNTVLEVAWTVVPVLILVVIAIPSFRLLYFLDAENKAEMTIKITGHQWYWEYTYPDNGDFSFMSNMVADEDIAPDGFRILDVDNPVVVPVNTDIRLLITSGDVMHSWGVPSMGFTRDAIPGRLNEISVRIEREGIFYGQCRELCGVGHAVMPVAIHAVSKEQFAQWAERAKEEFASNTPATSPTQLAENKTSAKGADLP